jgi:hypothetical protein
MQLRLWWWRKIRYADIPKEHRDIFERFGESVIQSMVAASHQPRAAELRAMYPDDAQIKNACEWLTERADAHEQREQRLETVEWAILLFLAVSVYHEFFGSK